MTKEIAIIGRAYCFNTNALRTRYYGLYVASKMLALGVHVCNSVSMYCTEAVERGHKRTRCVRDRVCVKFERPRRYRYRYRYRYQKKKARRGRARDPVL